MELLQNKVLWCVTVAWFIAQFSKPFVQYLRTREWAWSWFFSAGGMPSTAPVDEMPEELWDKVVDLNLKSAFLCQLLQRHAK